MGGKSCTRGAIKGATNQTRSFAPSAGAHFSFSDGRPLLHEAPRGRRREERAEASGYISVNGDE